MPREIKRDPKLRAAAAEQKRLRRAQLTDEERKKARAVEAERARQKRAQMTEEDLEKRRARDAQKKRERRSALKSEEELQPVKSRKAEYTRQPRAKMTEAELIDRRTIDAAKQREKRLTLKSDALEKLQKVREREAELKRQKRAAMNEEEREKRRAQESDRMRIKKSQMAKEELKKLNAQKSEYNRQRRARWTEEERKRFKAMQSERKRLKENGTSVEKIRHMTSMVVELTKRHPARFEIIGTEFKNSLSDLLNLHAEIEKLRKTLKQTVADAVKNAVRHQGNQKQAKAAGYRSLTFVQVPLLPLDFKYSIPQEFTSAEENETDPLIPQSDFGTEFDLTNESTDENTNDKKDDRTFKVCTYESVAACEKNSNASKKLECLNCSKKFGTSLGLTIHQKEHADDSVEFKCSLCPQMFHKYNLMSTHYLEFHSLEFNGNEMNNEVEAEETDEVLERHRHELEFLLLRKCLICFQAFDVSLRLSTYSHHIINDHSDNKELLRHFTYICTHCDKPHAVLRSLEWHWKTFCYDKWKNKDWNNRGIVCEKCGLKFSNGKSLSSHERISHIEKEKIMCEQCGKEFNDEKLLKMHVKAMHDGAEFTFTCDQCGKCFKLKQSLTVHTKTVHLGERRFACKICFKGFQRNAELEYHMNTHTGEKPFRCKYCDNCYASKNVLNLHEDKHKGIIYQRKRTGGNSLIKCDICDKSFKSMSKLRNHKNSHDNVKRFGCSLCERTFRQQSTYYKHKLKTHKNENPKIVKLISEEESNAFATLLPNSDAATMLFNTPDMGNSTTPNVCLLEQGLEDYSPEMEYDNEIIETEIPLPQFEADELENANIQNSHISLSGSTNEENSIHLEHPAFETTIKDFQKTFPYSSSFIDFSRANVPSVEKTVNVANKKDTEGSEQNVQVFIEDTEKDSFVADVDMNEFVKIKMEAVEGVDEQFRKLQVKSEAEIIAEQHFSSPFPIVKMTKLLETKCVPCCKTIFAVTQREIRSHCRAHSRNESRKRIKSESSIHNRRKKSRTRLFACLYCQENNLTSIEVIAHCADEHPGKEPLQCKMCPKMFFNSREYFNHKTKTHFTANGNSFGRGCFDCLYCEKKNLSGREIGIHCSEKHPGQKPIKCRECPKMLKNIYAFYHHKTKKHNPPKPKPPRDPNAKVESVCEVCGKAFLTKQQMWVHRSNMHRAELDVECDICHKMVRGKRNLKLHKQRHLGIKPHLCEECGMGFCTPQELKEHVRVIHRGEKKRSRTKTNKTHPFPCLLCPCRFVKEVGLQKHMPLHDPERQYPCDQCGLRFRTYDIRFSHIKLKHKNIKYIRKPKLTQFADLLISP